MSKILREEKRNPFNKEISLQQNKTLLFDGTDIIKILLTSGVLKFQCKITTTKIFFDMYNMYYIDDKQQRLYQPVGVNG